MGRLGAFLDRLDGYLAALGDDMGASEKRAQPPAPVDCRGSSLGAPGPLYTIKHVYSLDHGVAENRPAHTALHLIELHCTRMLGTEGMPLVGIMQGSC